jgi:hypothetical protein
MAISRPPLAPQPRLPPPRRKRPDGGGEAWGWRSRLLRPHLRAEEPGAGKRSLPCAAHDLRRRPSRARPRVRRCLLTAPAGRPAGRPGLLDRRGGQASAAKGNNALAASPDFRLHGGLAGDVESAPAMRRPRSRRDRDAT